MKKVFASILAILYLSTSMGATVHLHYCMGRLVAWGLVDHESKDCVSCGMAKSDAMPGCSATKKNCCHDEHKHLQSDRAQKPAQTWVEWNLAPGLVPQPFPGWSAPLVIAPAIAQPVANGPPSEERVPIFLRNCNFRI